MLCPFFGGVKYHLFRTPPKHGVSRVSVGPHRSVDFRKDGSLWPTRQADGTGVGMELASKCALKELPGAHGSFNTGPLALVRKTLSHLALNLVRRIHQNTHLGRVNGFTACFEGGRLLVSGNTSRRPNLGAKRGAPIEDTSAPPDPQTADVNNMFTGNNPCPPDVGSVFAC